jgi:hypothetical protein
MTAPATTRNDTRQPSWNLAKRNSCRPLEALDVLAQLVHDRLAAPALDHRLRAQRVALLHHVDRDPPVREQPVEVRLDVL